MNPFYRRHFERAQETGLVAKLIAASAKHKLPPEIVLAVASRETHIQNISGDGGHGRGVMQVDDRYHDIARTTDFKKHPEPLIDYACKLLAGNIAWAAKKWPDFDERQHLKIALSAYNAGRGGAEKGVARGDSDLRTTGHDYAKDVLNRATSFADLLEEVQG